MFLDEGNISITGVWLAWIEPEWEWCWLSGVFRLDLLETLEEPESELELVYSELVGLMTGNDCNTLLPI